jgi:hypothetical protein
MITDSGERQWSRQARFSGVHWNTPAANSRPPPSAGLVLTIIGETSAASSRAPCSSVAAALNAVQTVK